MLEVRRAKTDDLEAVTDFYHEMIDAMAGTDFDVLWVRDEHPTDEFIAEAIADGRLFIGTVDDEIACGLAVDQDPAPGFENVPWQVDVPVEDTWIVHIVATLPAHHGKGYAGQLIKGALDAAKEAGIKSVRLDTFDHNARARRLYEKAGFTDLGAYPVWYEYLDTIYPRIFEYVI